MYEISVLVSGKGTLLDSLATHCFDDYEGMLYNFIRIKQVVADRECPALEVAKKWNIPAVVVPKQEPAEDWAQVLFDHDVDLHVMAGFLSIVKVPEDVKGKVVNFHPSIDAKYSGKGMYGIHVHKAVVENNESFTGITMHYVEDECDKGAIIDQYRMGVLPWDTPESLMYSVQKMEYLFCPRALLNFLKRQPK